jgi:hypothetical protein
MDGGGIVASRIFIFGDGMSHRQNEREPIMDLQNDDGGSVATMAEQIKKVMLNGAQTPEEFKQRKAELEFATMKNRIINRERHHEKLKEAARRTLRGETDYE